MPMKACKKNNPGPQTLFSNLRIKNASDRLTIIILLISLLLALLIILVSTQFGSLFTLVRSSDFPVGEVAEKDFVVERDILYTDEKATLIKKEAAEKLVHPVFRVNEELIRHSLARFDEFQESFIQLLQEETPLDTIYLKIQLTFPGILENRDLDELYSFPLLENLFSQVRLLLEEVLQIGIINLPEQTQELFSAGVINVWRWRGGRLEKEEYSLNDVLTLRSITDWLEKNMDEYPEESAELIRSLVEAFAVENGFIDLEQTQKQKLRAADKIEPVMAKLVEGQNIIRKGDIVKEEAAAQIKAVGDYSANINLISISGTVLLILIVFTFSLYILDKRIIKIQIKRNEIFFLALAALFYLLYSAVLSKFFNPIEGVPFSVILPTAALSILVTLSISANVGFIFTFILSLFLLPIIKLDIHSFLFVILTGIAGTAVVINAEKRIDLIRAGFFLCLINCLILLALGFLGNYQNRWLLPAFGWGLLNGFLSSLIGLGFLPVLEHLLNASTRFRLRELADTNAPILKRMLTLAPGTYSHSISVANLAESACNEINANALLARVGAYYHDIGKIDQAEYFIENQKSYNKHDELKPSLSVAVIKSHVKIGIEKAKELALPPDVIDIVAQHHGGGIIKYFYQRALENDKKANVTSEDYSYPGKRPRSKEAAVVLLADTAEAASRVLKKPTIAKLEKFVWNIIMEKITSNELSDCNLTLKDLEDIKKSFVQILGGYFHSRIEYPRVKEETH